MDLEEIERAEVMRDVNRTVRGQVEIGIGNSGKQKLDPSSNSPRLMPNHDTPED